MGARHRGLGTAAAALVALLMLSYASIQSVVMQVAMARPGAAAASRSAPEAGAADAMAGMAQMGMAKGSRLGRSAGHGLACPYCAAAAHLPTLNGATPFRAPSAFTFAAFRVVASHGPRGPPARQPRARGPPTDPLTL